MNSPYKGKTGLTRIINAWSYSIDGLKAAYRHENAFRQEVWLALLLIPLALYLEPGKIERVLLIGSVMLVLMVELLNSAIEATVDRISAEHHELAKRAKDVASAAVLLSLINLVVIWCLVLIT